MAARAAATPCRTRPVSVPYRALRRTVTCSFSLAGGFFVVSMVLKLVARMWAAGSWLGCLSFLSLFQPQELILAPPPNGWPGLRYDAILVLLGLLSYAIAAIVFWWRDIPAPR